MAPDAPLLAAVELGGTKTVVLVGTGPDDVRLHERIPTTAPAETLNKVLDRLRPFDVAAVGVGAFGPVDLDRQSPTWGCVTETPKPGWSGAAVAAPLADALGVPVGFETDVAAAAFGEARWGAGRGVHSLLYLTVGTGIGGGFLADGRPLQGLVHPEMGHVRVRRHPDDAFPGVCPFHGDCLEGLASGPAIEARWGQPGADLPPDHPAWELEAHYLTHALANFVLTLSPERIVLGGGVMHQAGLFPPIRERLAALLGGYVRHATVLDGMESYVVLPGLGDRAGALGGLVIAAGVLRHAGGATYSAAGSAPSDL